MEYKNEKKREEKPSASDKIMDKAADKLNWWNRAATINEDDSMWVGFTKIVIRIIGILLLIAISPFVIIGLIVGMTAAF
ncbi:MAG: hypothetical protein ACJAT4_000754 [Granulosicoccus sp.]|jgi:hypothetical protein